MGKELDWGKCPECGEELFNISDHEENLVMCTKCGKTFPEPPLGPATKKRKAKKGKEMRLPFGKHKGRTLREIMHEEPGYLCWFHDTVEDQRGAQGGDGGVARVPGEVGGVQGTTIGQAAHAGGDDRGCRRQDVQGRAHAAGSGLPLRRAVPSGWRLGARLHDLPRDVGRGRASRRTPEGEVRPC